jgi:hypothetical protein
LTGPQASQIRSYLLAKYGIANRELLICDGNSLTFGTGSSPAGYDYPTQLQALLTGGATSWKLVNNGVAGQTTPAMDTRATPSRTRCLATWSPPCSSGGK